MKHKSSNNYQFVAISLGKFLPLMVRHYPPKMWKYIASLNNLNHYFFKAFVILDIRLSLLQMHILYYHSEKRT